VIASASEAHRMPEPRTPRLSDRQHRTTGRELGRYVSRCVLSPIGTFETLYRVWQPVKKTSTAHNSRASWPGHSHPVTADLQRAALGAATGLEEFGQVDGDGPVAAFTQLLRQVLCLC
jgi:hypothetical protein